MHSLIISFLYFIETSISKTTRSKTCRRSRNGTTSIRRGRRGATTGASAATGIGSQGEAGAE